MADRPCTNCRSTLGRQSYLYVNWYDVDDTLIKRRVRLCQQCTFEVAAPLLENADRDTPKGWQFSDQLEDEKPWRNAISAITQRAQPAGNTSTQNEVTSITTRRVSPSATPQCAESAPTSSSSEQKSSSARSSNTETQQETRHRSSTSKRRDAS